MADVSKTLAADKTHDSSAQLPSSESAFIRSAPSVSLPKGGGAIQGMGEKFSANLVTGTGSLSVPIPTSPARSGFGPQLSLSYDTGSGNGPFGFGWSLSLPSITRKTDDGLPKYQDAIESDVYILSGSEDLVPVLQADGTQFIDSVSAPGFIIYRYRPRIEGLFARIERWINSATGDIHWRSISHDNITTHYGKTENSRITDPNDPNRIFSWLICESLDDKGNAIVYTYANEDAENVDQSLVNERNRTRTAQRYLKRIQYGNRSSHLIQPDLTLMEWLFEVVLDYEEDHYQNIAPDPNLPEAEQHQLVLASNSAGQAWASRPDPFSIHRAGFEIRTHRRCYRIMMFHHFAELGEEPCLVRCTEFDYADLNYAQPHTIDAELAHPGSSRFASFISAITQSGYVRDQSQEIVEINGIQYVPYLKKSLPPLEFEYSRAVIQDDLLELDTSSLENLPIGLDGTAYQWIDLDGEGISGILSEQAGAWFYKPNLGNGHFGSIHAISPMPSPAHLQGNQQLLDLSGDGQLDAVVFSGPTPGFHERTLDENWETFKTFRTLPTISWNDPNVRFVDLTGDGHADVLMTEDDVFTWYESLGEDGFGPAQQIKLALDEEKNPRLVFADGTEGIYLADMSGDGLMDLVRIRNGEVCYWPNQGYGHFGAKVSMDQSPWFDHVDQFDHKRLRLADLDGSGPSDIVYLGRNTTHLYFNQAGNRWSAARPLTQALPADNLTSITTVDLLGTGTSCLVWSSPLPSLSKPLRYIDLMGSQKPHLLVRSANNLGAETRIHYAMSTQFYLADKQAGTPWISRLPFPVHVVERVETYDRISRNRFITRYAYHHGYFDGVEREFRGFGRVDQWDTEELAALSANANFPNGDNIDATSHVPPVYTKTWFHTGFYLGREHISDFFAGLLNGHDTGEYYREPGLTDADARQRLLDDTVLPLGLNIDEEREACRALKGSMLRQEVYALDGSSKEAHPYMVTEQNFTVEALQAQGDNPHAVFFTHTRESINYHYERNPSDPRCIHALTLEVDAYGNVLKSATIGYGRRQPDPTLSADDQNVQAQTLITYTENNFTNSIEGINDYRKPLSSEARTFELTGLKLSVGQLRFSFEDVLTAVTSATVLSYEQTPTSGTLQKRLIEHVRTLYRHNDLSGPLSLGTLESQALPFESYKLAFTPGLITAIYGGRISDAMLETEGRYVHSEGDANHWIASGQVFYSPVSTDTAAQELSYARQHFFLPHRYQDPFHTALLSTESFVSYDHYDLLQLETRDALGNRTTAGERDAGGTLVSSGHDYRVLQPSLLMDANRNRTAVAYDALGYVVGTAIMGKPLPATPEGDSLENFEADLPEAVTLAHLANPLLNPQSLLQHATTRLVYDLFAYSRTQHQAKPQPAVVYTLSRETHDSDPLLVDGLKIQHSFIYSDGFGREIQKKIQAEAGAVPQRDNNGDIILDANGLPEMTPNAVTPRWVGSGWTVFNNKGKAVRQYEPFFTDTHHFEFDVRIGVSPIFFYDPVGRIVGILHPNHSWEKTVFDAWQQTNWDVNDTVGITAPETDADIGDFFQRLPATEYLPTWYSQREGGALGSEEQTAARKAFTHAETPTVTHADSLGRTFLSIAHNRFKYSDTPPADPPIESFHPTRTLFDIEGNERAMIDAKDRLVVRYDYDMLSHRIHTSSMEAGERWILNDVADKPIRTWDSLNHQFRTEYDVLRRPTDAFMREGAATEILIGRTVYGETQPNPETNNLRGKIAQVFDQAGILSYQSYDFKSNLLQSQRQLAQAYSTTLDWSVGIPMEAELYTTTTRYDALNRPIELSAPDNSLIRPSYNEANLLERVDANLRGIQQNGQPVWTPFITNIDYDAKGQRTLIDYGNNVRTTYDYDPLTFRLTQLLTRRNPATFPDDCPQPQAPNWPGCNVQNLNYTYDAVGNITRIRDNAQQTRFFRNKRVEPSADYSYDALYQLIEATGREHLGQAGANPLPGSYNDASRVGILFSASDGNAMGRYLQRYLYDLVGNFQSMIHQGSDPVNPGWTRLYTYNEPSQLEPGKFSNRLTSTQIGANTETYSTAGNGYDAHGNLLKIPQLSLMQWDYKNQLRLTQRQAINAQDDEGTQHQGERTWYVYDASGQRIRKVTEATTGQIKDERIYIGAFEVYRRHGANPLVRETLHIMDSAQQRTALVETRTSGNEANVPEQLIRYQFGNHLGSASLELDDQAHIIAYEEYTPYGSTSFQAVSSQTEVPKRRYRYTGKERDEENGLYYHGARYYAPWLGRWINTDPIGIKQNQTHTNLYEYSISNPITYYDPDGHEPKRGQLGTAKEITDDAKAHMTPVSQTRRDDANERAKAAGAKQDLPATLDLQTYLDVLTQISTREKQKLAEKGNSTIGQSVAIHQMYQRLALTELVRGLGELTDHFEADRFFTKNNSGAWVDDTSRTDSRNVKRYVYTTSLGWIDMHHFYYFATATAVNGADSSRAVSTNLEWLQGKIGRDASSYSYEDLPSNEAGIQFYEKYGQAMLSGRLSIAEATKLFLRDAGAVDPSQSPNFDYIPQVIRDNDPPMKNKTSTPWTGDTLKKAHEDRFNAASAARKKEIIEGRSIK